MTDIVELLRDYSPYEANHVVHEAADEIERLRSALGSGVTITNEFYFSLVSRAEAAEARVRELEAEVAHLGVMGDVCTYHTLKKVCEGCRCKRATASAGVVHEGCNYLAASGSICNKCGKVVP
jgi:hypothetical protein